METIGSQIKYQHIEETELYWSTRESKKWVVRLVSRRGSDTKYVCAKTEEAAIKSAIANSMIKGKVVTSSARLASPRDLGCV